GPRAPKWSALDVDTTTRGGKTDEGFEIIHRLWRTSASIAKFSLRNLPFRKGHRPQAPPLPERYYPHSTAARCRRLIVKLGANLPPCPCCAAAAGRRS